MGVVYACLPPTPNRWEALYTASRLTHNTQSQAFLGLSLSRMAADGHALHAKRTSLSSIHGVTGLWRLAHDVIEAVQSKRSRDHTHACTKQCQRTAQVQGAVFFLFSHRRTYQSIAKRQDGTPCDTPHAHRTIPTTNFAPGFTLRCATTRGRLRTLLARPHKHRQPANGSRARGKSRREGLDFSAGGVLFP